ncbi:ABC transporter permease [Paenibacillus sp. GP183]|uniref:ABC transporter permease n=1 Tax=Paenibacillus sp. GP183 TaxID=1882751 RepID=UPI0008998B5A|nr:ABC transporter permease [Paenibacillus sp. GP183]SEB43521.1 ABC-2 type transport system permease protein [Paenibacillus sp. GP183]
MNSLYIALNMLKRTLGQRKGLFIYIVIPTFVISLIIALAGQAPTRVVTIAYMNQDQGNLGKHLVQELSLRKDYILKEMSHADMLKEHVIKQQADAAFIIPANFSDSLYKGNVPQVQMYQLSVSEASFTLKLHVDSIVGELNQTVSSLQAASLQGAVLQSAVEKTLAQMEKHQVKAAVTDLNLYVNPGLSTIIGFMLMFMMSLINSTVSIIMEDRKQMTMARIYTAPVRSFEIVMGNFMGSFLVGNLQILLILSITRYILQFDYHLPFVSQLVIMEFFLLASMGIASAVAGMVKNSSNITSLNTLIITPTCMLGGCFWPVSIMPDWMQKLSNFVPQKWAIDAIQRMSMGQGLMNVLLNLGVLALFAIILLGIGSVILRPEKAEAS